MNSQKIDAYAKVLYKIQFEIENKMPTTKIKLIIERWSIFSIFISSSDQSESGHLYLS